MKFSKTQILAILLLGFCNSLNCQNDISSSNSDFTFGFGTKLTIEFSHVYAPDYKFSITGGVGYYGRINEIGITPTVHAGILLFNRGSVGADQSKKWKTIQAHTFFNTTATFQMDKRDFSFFNRFVPLYHFSEFTANPLQNPYKSSFSYGMNLILVDEGKLQRTGFLNFNILGRAQLSYYNDGGPILGWAGDNQDRYYTGGVVLSYHGEISDLINLVELSYHKYTGYQKYAFDVADKLQIDFLNYNDKTQFAYNQQRWRLNFSNLDNGFGGSISLYNANRLDLQDFLHFNTNVPYHPDYYGGYRWMFGVRHEYNNVKLSR